MSARAIPSRSTTRRAAQPALTGLTRWVRGRAGRGAAFGLSATTVGGPRPGHLHLDWVQSAERLTPAQCADIAATGRSFPQEPPTVVGEEILSAHRVGTVHLLPNVARTQTLYRLLWDVAADAAVRHYGMAINAITRVPHYVEYGAGHGHFRWHNDYSHEAPQSPRKLTVIVQLSAPDEYEGGDLEVFNVGPQALPRAQGAILCFPSFVTHCVTPVTAGVRRVVVAWIAGPRIA